MSLRFDHPRSEWQDPARPVTGPAFPAWAGIDLIVIHYPGVTNVPDGDPGESLAQFPGYLRANQNFYLDHRGYSIGYNAAVDWEGGTWELRGDTFKSAATKALNHRSFAIKIVRDIGSPATIAQIEAVRDLVVQIRRHAPEAEVIGHRDGRKYSPDATVTSCPGDAIYAQVQAGLFEPVPGPPPAPDAPPLMEDDDMPRRAGKLYNPGGPGDGGFWIEAAGGKRRHVGSNDDPRPQWQGHEARLLAAQGLQDSKTARIVFHWDEIRPVDEAFLNTYVGRP